MSLNQDEKNVLAELLEKAENKDIRGPVWHALVKKFPTVPIELMVFNDKKEVFLVYRDDAEFTGWHHPGSCWNDWETLPERRQKLVDGEIIKDAGIKITEPISIGWMGVYRGDGPDENGSRNACSLIHMAHLASEFTPKQGYGFFPLDNLPEDTLGCHKYILRRVKQYLVDGVTLCD